MTRTRQSKCQASSTADPVCRPPADSAHAALRQGTGAALRGRPHHAAAQARALGAHLLLRRRLRRGQPRRAAARRAAHGGQRVVSKVVELGRARGAGRHPARARRRAQAAAQQRRRAGLVQELLHHVAPVCGACAAGGRSGHQSPRAAPARARRSAAPSGPGSQPRKLTGARRQCPLAPRRSDMQQGRLREAGRQRRRAPAWSCGLKRPGVGAAEPPSSAWLVLTGVGGRNAAPCTGASPAEPARPGASCCQALAARGSGPQAGIRRRARARGRGQRQGGGPGGPAHRARPGR